MSSNDPSPHDQEINDLETARLALHGLLARNRSMQELNERLKEEVRDALNRERAAQKQAEDAKADKRVEVLEHIVATAQRTQKTKEKEIFRLHEDLQRKDKIIKELQSEAENARIRQRAELTAMAERARADIRAAVAEATQGQEAVIQGLRLHSVQQIEAMQEHCRQFEAEVAKKEQLLTKDFLERNEKLSGQWKAREEDLWQQNKRIQETLKADLDALLVQRLTSLDLERQKDKETLSQRMAELEAQFLQRRADLQGEFEAREKRLREAYQQSDADMQKRLARREPSQEQQRLQEKDALEKQARQFEEQWLAREAVIRGEYQNLEKNLRAVYEKSERQIRAQHKETLLAAEIAWTDRLKTARDESAEALRRAQENAELKEQARLLREDQIRQEYAKKEERRMLQLQQELDSWREAARVDAANQERLQREGQMAADETAREHARQAQSDLLRRFAQERDQLLKKQAELLQQQSQEGSAAQQEQFSRYEAAAAQMQSVIRQQEARLAALQLEGVKAEEERRQLRAMADALTEELKCMERDAQAARGRMQEERTQERAQWTLANAQEIVALQAQLAALKNQLVEQQQKFGDLDNAQAQLETYKKQLRSAQEALLKKTAPPEAIKLPNLDIVPAPRKRSLLELFLFVLLLLAGGGFSAWHFLPEPPAKIVHLPAAPFR